MTREAVCAGAHHSVLVHDGILHAGSELQCQVHCDRHADCTGYFYTVEAAPSPNAASTSTEPPPSRSATGNCVLVEHQDQVELAAKADVCPPDEVRTLLEILAGQPMSLESVAAETETFVGLLDLDLSLANNVSTVQPELIEQVSHRILSALGPGQNVSVNRVHVRLTARRTDPNLSSSFELRPVRSGATLTLPGTSQVNGSTGGGVLVIEYETDQLFRQNQSIPGASAVATNVVSIIVEGANRTVNGFLGGARANLAFAHGAVGAWQSASCAWWHIADASWTHDVRVASRSASMVNCSTDHLTSFAVLMDVGESGSTVSADHATALSLITFIGVGVSIVCLVLVLAAYAIVKEARTPAKLILMNLSLSLLATLVLFLIVASVDTTDSTNANSEVSSTTCRAIGVSLHYFLLATFGWMLVEGRQLYNQFANVFKDRRSHFSLTAKAAVVYITPAVYITIINILWKDAYRTDGLCWLDNSNNALWLFVGPALGIVLINVIMLTKIIRVSHRRVTAVSLPSHCRVTAGSCSQRSPG